MTLVIVLLLHPHTPTLPFPPYNHHRHKKNTPPSTSASEHLTAFANLFFFFPRLLLLLLLAVQTSSVSRLARFRRNTIARFLSLPASLIATSLYESINVPTASAIDIETHISLAISSTTDPTTPTKAVPETLPPVWLIVITRTVARRI